MKAIWNDTIIAESNDTVVVENNDYFPPEAIHSEYFKKRTPIAIVLGKEMRFIIVLL